MKPTIPTPGDDKIGTEGPAGKVIRHYVNESFLSATALSDTQLTKIENTNGSTTLTFEDPTSSKGELELSVNDDFGGVRGPTVDPSQFQEIRFGVIVRDGLTGKNRMFLGFWDTTGVSNASSASTYIRQREDNTTADVYSESANKLTDINFDMMESAPRYLEIRLRPSDQELRVVSGAGDAAESIVTDSSFNISGTQYPRCYVGTSYEGNTEPFHLSRIWLSVVHN